MTEQLAELLDIIELLRIVAAELKEDHSKCLCPMTRQRLAWDWHKALSLKRKRQKEALDLADQIIPSLDSILI